MNVRKASREKYKLYFCITRERRPSLRKYISLILLSLPVGLHERKKIIKLTKILQRWNFVNFIIFLSFILIPFFIEFTSLVINTNLFR